MRVDAFVEHRVRTLRRADVTANVTSAWKRARSVSIASGRERVRFETLSLGWGWIEANTWETSRAELRLYPHRWRYNRDRVQIVIRSNFATLPWTHLTRFSDQVTKIFDLFSTSLRSAIKYISVQIMFWARCKLCTDFVVGNYRNHRLELRGHLRMTDMQFGSTSQILRKTRIC